MLSKIVSRWARAVYVLIVWAIVNIASAQTMPVIQWVNSSSTQISLINPGDTFTTNFRGSNDATVTLVSGNTGGLFNDHYGGATPGNNPSYLKNFVGRGTNGTGDGQAGGVTGLSTTGASSGAIQFDFAQPLTAADRLLFTDIDVSESYTITAYKKVNANFVQISTAGWVHQAYSGRTGITPDSRWPTWDGSSGTFTSNAPLALADELDVLVPDGSFDRFVVTKTNGAGWSTDLQVAEPIGAGLGDVNFDGHVDAKDIAAMEQALSNKPGYAQTNAVTTATLDAVGDENMDGKFSNADLQKLLNVLKAGGGSTSVPEPASMVLLALGCAMLARRGRS